MWPGSRIHFFDVMKDVRWEDYEIQWCEGNRFAYLANGFAARESDGSDLSWYLGDSDDTGKQPVFREEDLKQFIMY